MATDVPIIRQSNSTVQQMPTIAPVGGEAEQATQRLAQAAFQMGDSTFQRVEENAYLGYQTQLSASLSRIERENIGNPQGMAKSMSAYKKTFLKEVKIPALQGRLGYQFEASAQTAINRAHAQFQSNVDEEAQVGTFLSLDDIQTQMDNAAQGAFSKDPAIAASSVVQLQELMGRQQSLANQRKTDGSYLFSPEAAANMTIAARDKTHTALAKTWFKNQPNKLQAAQEWLDGAVEYDLPNSVDTAIGLQSLTPDQIFDTGLIAQESGGDQSAVSPKGAIGIAQIMPDTGPEAAKLAGVSWDPKKFKNDAAYNKKLGKAYFKAQVDKYGDTTLALMAYNAGPGAVDDFMNGTNLTKKNPNNLRLGDPRTGEISVNSFAAKFPFKETRDYVKGVKAKSGVTTVNVRETMPSTTRQKVDNEIMSILQDSMAIENHQLVMEQKADKAAAQTTFGNWVRELQTPGIQAAGDGNAQGSTGIDKQSGFSGQRYGPPTPNQQAEEFFNQRQMQIAQLDAQAQIFMKGGMQDEYFALRKSLVSGEPLVEDGATIMQMKNMMAKGQDISTMGLAALNSGRIGAGTYDAMINRQEQLRGPAGDPTTFYLSRVQSSIAGLTPSGDPNSAILAYNAQTQFLTAVENWKQDPANAGKVPTMTDLKPLADQAITAFNPNPDGAVLSLTAPSYIPANLYSAPTTEGVAKMQTLVKETYVKKYGSDINKIKNDPDAIRDFEWVKKIEKQIAPSTNSVGN